MTYELSTQVDPIQLCPPAIDNCDYDFPDDSDVSNMPVKKGDVIRWIMNKDEITLDAGSSIDDLRVAIVQEGVTVALNIGTIAQVDGSDQYYCTATIPCLQDNCNYQLAFYDNAIGPPIDCSLYSGDTLEQVIDSGISLGQVLNCMLSDFI